MSRQRPRLVCPGCQPFFSDLPSLELGAVCPAGHAWLFPHCQPLRSPEDFLMRPPKEKGAFCGRRGAAPRLRCFLAERPHGRPSVRAVMRLFRIATGRMLRPVKRETGARRGSTGTIRRMTTVHHRGHGSCNRMISRRDKHHSLSFSRHPLFLIGIGHVAPSCRTN